MIQVEVNLSELTKKYLSISQQLLALRSDMTGPIESSTEKEEVVKALEGLSTEVDEHLSIMRLPYPIFEIEPEVPAEKKNRRLSQSEIYTRKAEQAKKRELARK